MECHKCHACHAKPHLNFWRHLDKESFCSFPHRHCEAMGKPRLLVTPWKRNVSEHQNGVQRTHLHPQTHSGKNMNPTGWISGMPWKIPSGNSTWHSYWKWPFIEFIASFPIKHDHFPWLCEFTGGYQPIRLNITENHWPWGVFGQRLPEATYVFSSLNISRCQRQISRQSSPPSPLKRLIHWRSESWFLQQKIWLSRQVFCVCKLDPQWIPFFLYVTIFEWLMWV